MLQVKIKPEYLCRESSRREALGRLMEDDTDCSRRIVEDDTDYAGGSMEDGAEYDGIRWLFGQQL